MHCIWPPGNAESATPSTPQLLRAALAAGVQRMAEELTLPGCAISTPLLSTTLSAALCRLQRVRRLRPTIEARVLVVHASVVDPTQYLPAMNCVFGAQKLGVLIDAVLVGVNWRATLCLVHCAPLRHADHLWQHALRDMLAHLILTRAADKACKGVLAEIGALATVIDAQAALWPSHHIKPSARVCRNEIALDQHARQA